MSLAEEVAATLVLAALKLYSALGKDPKEAIAKIHEEYSADAQKLANDWTNG